jgi:transcription elongation GreA/GreB family factor
MKIYITDIGKQLYEQKIEELTKKVRAIQEEKAIAYTASGDGWHDNPGFNQLEQMEFRAVNELAKVRKEYTEAIYVSVGPLRPTEKIQIGSKVRVRQTNCKTKQVVEQTWEIVGYGESNVQQRRISYDSPIGKVLLGKTVGDSAEVSVPAGLLKFEILGFEAY